MKFTVLVDNNTFIDQYYLGEAGVSYFIEDGDTRVLFDVGYSDVFIKNAAALHIPLEEVHTFVFSHGHDDHTGGLKYYFEQFVQNKFSIIAHPDTFHEKVFDGLKICSPVLQEELTSKCNLVLSKEPVKISHHLYYLGEIPETNDFEIRSTIGRQKVGDRWEDDYVMDDSALAYKSDHGIYIITGCSHSGICNIVEHAKKVCRDDRILGIIGGFHLFEVNDQVKKTIHYLRQNQIKELYPCHCTSFAVKAEIFKYIPLIKEVGVGLEINWE